MITYATAAAFKQALETRLRASSATGADFGRRRQLLVFERFLARIAHELGDTVIVKGGVVVELRVERARTTKDIDLRVVGSPSLLPAQLARVARLDLGDFLRFEIAPDAAHPRLTNEGMVHEGQRHRVSCSLAGKPYGQPFGLDIAFADPILGEPDIVVTDDILGFAGVPPPTLRIYPLETHIAEKLHAYTMPRTRPNSRLKDLPDIALLAGVREIEGARLREALELTFSSRKMQALPAGVPPPPADWAARYVRMVETEELAWTTLAALLSAVEAFMNPVLTRQVTRWNPGHWRWE